MLPVWATVVLTLGTTMLGGLIGLGGSWLSVSAARRDRDAAEAGRLRAEGAAALAPVMLLVADINPDAIIRGYGDHTPGFVQDAYHRWLGQREELTRYVTGHPETPVVQLGLTFVTAVNEALGAAGVLAGQMPDYTEEIRAFATARHVRVVELSHGLFLAVRNEADPVTTTGAGD